MMVDHWEFVAAAYGLAIVVLGGYWRHLVKKERELMILTRRRDEDAARSGHPTAPPHPRPEPASRQRLP